MPGIVVAYDSTNQTASIQPGFKNIIQSGDDNDEVLLDYPVIDLVPVCFPRSGAWSITWPLSVGDAVTLMFTERALDQWRLLGQNGPQDPAHIRMCDLSDAIAFPVNLEPDSKPIASATPDHLVIAKDGGVSIHLNATGTIGLGSATPADSAARATVVDANLSALQAKLTAWEPVPNDGGAALKVILTALIASGWPSPSASSIVKVAP